MSLRIWLPLLGNLDNQGLDSQSQITGSNLSANNDGKIGACYKMGPSNNSCITLSQDAVRSFTECSVAMWVKINSWNTAYCTLFECGLASSVSWRYNSYIWCRNNTASSIVFSISDGTNYTGTGCSFGTLSTGVWYHLCGTYTSGKMCTYVNGNLVQEYSTTVIPNFSSVIRTMIGACKTDTYQTDCYYNDIRIYDHALSPKEVKEISKGLFLHYPLSDTQHLNLNLYKGSHDFSGWWGSYSSWEVDSSDYNGFTVMKKSTTWGGIYQNVTCAQGDILTISFWGKVDLGGRIISVHRSNLGNVTTGLTILDGNFSSSYDWVTTSDNGTEWKRYWGTVRIDSADITYLQWRIENNQAGKYLYLCGMQVEKGSIATPWTPNVNDIAIDNSTETDCSGYKYNGIKNNIVYSTGTSRYYASSIFNGTNSYIKVDTNAWMVQGMGAMTINVWAKSSSWASAHLFSCTESGGFNTEAGNSGYWRFPVHVYTNAERTATAYKYDSNEIQISALSTTEWNMLTFVYDSTGTKTYINGELHHTYVNTSYGIHFNTSARLFLGCEAATANPTSPYFSGQESDFRIYATALSASDIKELYQTSARIDNKQNLIAYEFIEDSSFTSPSVTKNGLVRSNNLEETTKVSLYNNGKAEGNAFIES